MTNEQLASFIKQGGNDELIPILWENVKGVLYKLSKRYYNAYDEVLSSYGITLWDIRQQAYNAFLKAIEGYSEDKGYKFITYLKYPFKNAVRAMLTKDLLNRADSLNAIIPGDGKDTEQGELVPDEHALDFVEQIERAEEVKIIQQTVHKAIDALPEQEGELIKEYHLKGRTYADIAADKGISRERVRQICGSGLRHLRGNKDIRRLGRYLDYGSSAAYHNTLGGFSRYGMSNVERIAIKRADTYNRESSKQKLYNEYTKLSEDYYSGRITREEFSEKGLQIDKLLDKLLYGI